RSGVLSSHVSASLPGLTRQSMTTLNAQNRTTYDVEGLHGCPGQARARRREGIMSSLTQAKLLDPHAVKAMLSDGRELALIDLREELIFSRNHLLWARSIPLSRLELRFARLVPRKDTRIVLC